MAVRDVNGKKFNRLETLQRKKEYLRKVEDKAIVALGERLCKEGKLYFTEGSFKRWMDMATREVARAKESATPDHRNWVMKAWYLRAWDIHLGIERSGRQGGSQS